MQNVKIDNTTMIVTRSAKYLASVSRLISTTPKRYDIYNEIFPMSSVYGRRHVSRKCACPHTSKIPNTSEKYPVSTSLSTVQSHMPNRNLVVAITTLVTVTLCFHNSALSCFILNATFGMLQQQDTLYFGYTNLGFRVQFQTIKSNHSCRQGYTCELPPLH